MRSVNDFRRVYFEEKQEISATVFGRKKISIFVALTRVDRTERGSEEGRDNDVVVSVFRGDR